MKKSSCADSYTEPSLRLLSGRGRGEGSEVAVASMCCALKKSDCVVEDYLLFRISVKETFIA